MIQSNTIPANDGLCQIILQKQQQLDTDPGAREKRNGLMILIKASDNTAYENLVKVLDEISIDNIKKYALVKLSPAERNWLTRKEGQQPNK